MGNPSRGIFTTKKCVLYGGEGQILFINSVWGGGGGGGGGGDKCLLIGMNICSPGIRNIH